MPGLLSQMPPVLQALLATVFTWLVTAAGAAVVFLLRRPGKLFLDGMLGFSAGVMTAASFWSLLSPAISMAEGLSMNAWLTVLTGFLCGGLFLIAGDRFFSGGSAGKREQSTEKRCATLFLSITIHNIPEGMAVGVAFGSLAYGLDGAALSAACMLALGIGLQNFPEGMAVSLPLLRDGCSKGKAFMLGQISGLVEPIAGVVGALLVLRVRSFMPWMLSFAAGAMICVVTEELIPESQKNGHSRGMTCFTMLGFAVMMALDVALG